MDMRDSVPAISPTIAWTVSGLLVLLAAIGYIHLGADFPNHSRWIDNAAKFTDEGWYASGALNHHLTGHWLVPGDFNPMVTICSTEYTRIRCRSGRSQ